jgi:hypothetical protein
MALRFSWLGEFHGATLLARARFWIIAHYSTKLLSFWLTNRARRTWMTKCRMIRRSPITARGQGKRKGLR